jgi:DNA repair protein RadC
LCALEVLVEAKAITIIAALELGRRRRDKQQVEVLVLNSSKRVFEYFRANLQDLLYEEFWGLYHNRGCKVLDNQLIGRGGNDYYTCKYSHYIAACNAIKSKFGNTIHNHPSGTLQLSQGDKILTTKSLKQLNNGNQSE